MEVGRRGHLDGHVGLVVAEVEGLLAAIAAAAPAVTAAASAGFTMTLGCKSRKEGKIETKVRGTKTFLCQRFLIGQREQKMVSY